MSSSQLVWCRGLKRSPWQRCLFTEPPKDNGGAEIVKYLLELDHGRGECVSLVQTMLTHTHIFSSYLNAICVVHMLTHVLCVLSFLSKYKIYK